MLLLLLLLFLLLLLLHGAEAAGQARRRAGRKVAEKSQVGAPRAADDFDVVEPAARPTGRDAVLLFRTTHL